MKKNGLHVAILMGLASLPCGDSRFVEADASDTDSGQLIEAKVSFQHTTDLLQAALRTHYGLGKDEWVWPEAVYSDSVVVRRNGKLYEFSYAISDSNDLTLGTAREVIMEPVPIAGQLVEAVKSATDKPANRFVIRVIRSGLSINGVDYPTAVLRESAPLFNGVRVYAVSDALHIEGGEAKRDVNKLVGRLSNSRFVESPIGSEILADLTVIESTGWGDRFREAIESGIADTYGFSIDASGEWKKSGRYREAKAIRKVSSVDVVAEPGAGGQLIRLVEAVKHPSKSESLMNREQMLALLRQINPQRAAALASGTDDEVSGAFREAVTAQAAAANAVPAAPAVPAVTAEFVAEQMRMVEARSTARSLIAASGLPAPAVERIQAEFAGRDRFVEADVTARIEGERAYLGRFVETPIIGLGRTSILAGQDRSEKIRQMLADFFKPDAMMSFREAYVEITGDTRVTGALRHCDRQRFAEATGRMVEAIDSSTFADVLGDSITRQMIERYNTDPNWQDWRDLCRVVPISDFRTQERTRVGGYGNLPDVAESGPYTALTTPTDEKATYALAKKGGTESITLEAISRDDVGLIRDIPQMLAVAAGRTLYEFVLDFLRTNPVVYDGTALFHASHNNLGAAALAANTFAAARLAMKRQTEITSAKRLGIRMRHLYVPSDLEELVFDLFVRGTNNDETFVQSRKPKAHVVDYWTDANNWFATADKSECPLIELGFYGGREQPELFVQDNPTQGSLFSNDKITWKIRHVYGGAVRDFRGLYGAIVA